MKKLYLSLIVISTSFIAFQAQSSDVKEAEKLKQILSASWGGDVNLEIQENDCKVIYPQTKIEDEVVEYLPSKDQNDEINVTKRKITVDIPENIAECKKTEDFNNHPQYSIVTTSPHKIISQIYNTLKMPFVKDIEIKSYNEEMKAVPDLEIIRYRYIDAVGISYTEKDTTTGLKREIGNIKNYKLQEKISEDNGLIKFKNQVIFNDFNLALPLFSLQIMSEKHAAEADYKISDNDTFNYNDMLNNIKYFSSAKSYAIGKSIKIGSDLMNFGIAFDIDIDNNFKRENEDSIKTLGKMTLKNISFSGDIISKEKQPKSIIYKYSLKNIPVDNLMELGKYGEIANLALNNKYNMDKTEQAPDNSEIENNNISEDFSSLNEDEIAVILDKIAQKAKFISEIDVLFNNAQIKVQTTGHVEKGYVHGITTVSINNLFTVFPELKQCSTPTSISLEQECVNNPQIQMLKDLIDISKNNSKVTYKYNERGIFKDNKKIAEPIELNFQKMYQEQNNKIDIETQDDLIDVDYNQAVEDSSYL